MKQAATTKVEIDFMFIDLEVCTRCRGTDANLETALREVRSVLQSAGAEVTVRRILVETESQALELGFVSSPTIRVNGRDIALELRETGCDSCGEVCACEGGIDCRVWVYEGTEYTIAPVPMIVGAILSSVCDTKGAPVPQRANAVPDNLKRFFAAKAAKAAPSCCSTEEQKACCEPALKASCCGTPDEAAQTACCGCR